MVEDNVNGAPTSLKKELRQGISYERWYSAYHYSRPPLVERCPPLGEPDKEKKIKETRPPLQQVATCPTLVFPCTLSKWISKKQNLILIWFFFISPYFLILNKSNFNKAILAIFLRACLFHFACFLLLLLLLFSFRFLLYFIYFTFYYYYCYYYYYILVVFKIIHQIPAFKEFSKFHLIYLFIFNFHL